MRLLCLLCYLFFIFLYIFCTSMLLITRVSRVWSQYEFFSAKLCYLFIISYLIHIYIYSIFIFNLFPSLDFLTMSGSVLPNGKYSTQIKVTLENRSSAQQCVPISSRYIHKTSKIGFPSFLIPTL